LATEIFTRNDPFPQLAPMEVSETI